MFSPRLWLEKSARRSVVLRDRSDIPGEQIHTSGRRE
jgi:hypothetical protein